MTTNKKLLRKVAKAKTQAQPPTPENDPFVAAVAERLTKVLEHPEASKEIKQSLTDILDEAAQEANLPLENQPNGASLVKIVAELEPAYSRALLTSLKSILGFGVSGKVFEDSAPSRKKVVAFAQPAKLTETVKIVPGFDQLTPKGVEMFTKMGDVENAKLFLRDLMFDIGDDQSSIAGVMILLEAIRQKINKTEKGEKGDHPEDFIVDLQRYLFIWTRSFDQSIEAYLEAVGTGAFALEKLVIPESKDETEAEIAA